MKIALMTYHKNLYKIYPKKWIEQYRSSISKQSFQKFDIYEVAYGEDSDRIFDGDPHRGGAYLHQEFLTFNHVQNFLLDFLFDDGYDCVFNSNVDDGYSPYWMSRMIPWIRNGYDLVSCNFYLLNEGGVIHRHENFHRLDIAKELSRNHNIICHPAVCYSRSFWEKGNRYNPEEVQTKNEDMKLWQRAIGNSKFIIVPEILCYHRIHSNSVCQSNNK